MRFARTLPSLLLLALFLLFAVAPGCGAESVGPGGEELRRSFPEQAAVVLSQPESFAATDEGFARGLPQAEGSQGLEVRLPRDAAGTIRMRSPSGFEARVREVGAAGESVVVEQAVSHRRAGGTSFWSTAVGGVEEWLHLDAGVARRGQPVAAWEVEGGAPREADGAVDVVDDAGAVQIRVTAPSAYAEGGRPIAARLTARGGTIELVVDADGEAVLVDPAWTAVPSMSVVRAYHIAALLPNGKVLVAGGEDSVQVATAELYDPATNTWKTTASMSTPRSYFNNGVVKLASGKVLVAGGYYGMIGTQATAEVYDGTTNAWTPAGTMPIGRDFHTLTLLANGQALAAGGRTQGGGTTTSGVDLYDPASNTWTAAQPMMVARNAHAAVLLGNGKVLVMGGQVTAPLADVEMYDPVAKSWSLGAKMAVARSNFAAIWIPSISKVLVSGGGVTTELYNPATNTWAPGPLNFTSRFAPTLTLLENGKVLVTGGGTAEVYDPAANTWSPYSVMVASRSVHTATLLVNGSVLVAGGVNFASAEIYMPLAGGVACTTAGDCASGFCVDGFCCNTACNGTCQACSAAKNGGANGTCGAVTAATDPDNDCAAQATSTCGTNGSCDGAGKCQLYATGTACAAASCSGSTLTKASACNGTGACVAGGTQSCGAYLCLGTACATTCATTSECTAGNVCIGNKCVPPQINGAACTLANQCASGFCADGFCCESACTGTCVSCSAAKTGGANGTCSGVVVATDPDNECTAQAASTCGTNGSCNGMGACQLFANGTPCAAPACMGNTLDKGSACNGVGTCTSNGTVSCAPYLCAGAACKTSCNADSECTGGTLCIGNKCGTPLPDGSVCATAGQCTSGNCVDGVCCNTACSAGACDACSVAAGAIKDGVCALLTGNTCDDGMTCTQGDTCTAGVCAGAVACAAIDACHTAGACDALGACTTPAIADGSTCEDGNGCTQMDTCQSGKCVSGSPVICAAPDGCHDVGVCSPKLGMCDYPVKENGTACDDGDTCSPQDSCLEGVCTPGQSMVCPDPDACHIGGACLKGVCPNIEKDVPCPLASECETIVSKCDVNTGACVKSTKPDGSPCGVGGSCLGGTCDGSLSTSAGTGSASTGSAGTGSAGTGSAGTGSAGTGSAGTGSAGTGAGGSGATGSGSAAGTGGNVGDGSVSPAGGCGCSTVGTSTIRAPWLLFGLVFLVRRRRLPRAA